MSDARNGKEADQVAALIRLLKMSSFINSPMKDAVVDPSGVSQVEVKVLLALSGEGALAGHDLVEIMGIPAMNVSRALASLRARGWIEDAQDPQNRRRKPVRLSEDGWREYRLLEPDFALIAHALLGHLDKRKLEAFSAISDTIIARMTEWITRHHDDVSFHG